MAIRGKELEIIRGVTLTLELTIRDQLKQLVALTGATIYFRVKTDLEAASLAIALSSAVPAEAEIDADQVTNKGKGRFFLSPSDTSGLAPGEYIYDVWVELVGGERHAVIKPSKLVLKRAVTELA
jgi:hypothetical protein